MTQDPDPQELAQAAFLLRLSARPVVLAGRGVAVAGAEEELARVAERLDAPVMTTWKGKGTISDNNPFAAGALFGQPEAAEFLEAADTVLALGTSFESGPGSPDLNLPAQTIQIDHDPAQIDRKYPVRLGITADIKTALSGILKALESPNPLKGSSDRTTVSPEDRTGPSRALSLREQALTRARQRGPSQMAALGAIRNALPDDTTVVHRHEASARWFLPFFEVADAGTWDQDLPEARPSNRWPVVVFCDDTGLTPALQEYAGTSTRKPIFVVFVEPGRPPSQEPAEDSDILLVGASGAADLEQALSRALAEPSPTIIESDLEWSAAPA